VLLFALLTALAAEPQTGVVTTPPALTTFVEAEYPAAAAAQNVTGTVTVSIDLDETGHVENVTLVDSPRPDFAAAALAAIKRFVFSPAEVDGRPAPVTLTYQYEFKVLTKVVKLGPQVNFEGTVLERFKKTPLANVTVTVVDVGRVATTDAAGHFEFVDLPVGPHTVKLSGEKLVEVTTDETIEPEQKRTVKYRVEEKQEGVDIEVTVRASRLKKESVQTAIRTEEARRVPGTQGDTLKVVQNLPGVARSSFGSGQLVVWGSAPRETRVLIDGVEVPSLYHAGGLRSVVSSELVKGIELLPGAFGPEYGRGLGGLVKVETRALPERGVHGAVQVDVLDASATLTAALGDRVRVAASGRYSYLDRLLAGVVAPDVADFFPIPRYSDYQAKVTVALRKDEELGLLFLGAHDDYRRQVASSDPTQVKSEQSTQHMHRLALRYSRLLDDGASFFVTPFIGFDSNATRLQSGAVPSNLSTDAVKPGLRAQYRSKVEPWLILTLGTDVLSTSAKVSRTGSITSPPREGDAYIFGRSPGDDVATDSWTTQLSDVSVYALAELPLGAWSITGGVRAGASVIDVGRLQPKEVGVPTIGGSTVNWTVDPRASVAFRPFKRWSLTASAGLYHQAPDPEDLSAVFGNPTLGLQQSVHTSLASNLKLTGTLAFDVVGFWKHSSNLVSRSSLSTPPVGQALTQNGTGDAYGVQVLLRQELFENFFGWVTYSLSRSTRRDQADQPERLFDFDQTHVLGVVASYEWRGFTFGVRFRWTSGLPRVAVNGAFYDVRDDTWQPLLGARNALRLPDFFQLDARVERRFAFKGQSLDVFLDVQNVWNQRNPEEIVYSPDYSTRRYITGLPLLAVLGVKYEF
jgi:TonB family protein